MNIRAKIIRFLNCENKILIDVIIMVVLAIISFFMPVASYAYRQNKYLINGIRFVTGADIMGGNVTIEPMVSSFFIMGSAALIIVTSVLFLKIKAKVSGKILALLSLIFFVSSMIYSKNVFTFLEEARAREISLESGSILLVSMSILMLIRALNILYMNKILGPLDLMAMPGMLYFVINNYLPMFGIFIAFKKVDYSMGIFNSPWIGFENFRYLFTTQDAYIMTRNTILYNTAFIIITNIVGIILGLLLFEIVSSFWQKFFQTTILLPQLISMIIVAYIVYGFLGNEAGIINSRFLEEGSEINFYMEKVYWPFILIIVNTWKMMGYSSIIYLSSIVGIDRSLYEAAKVDGATKLQQIFRVTLPMLKPTIITLLIMQVGRIFYSDFGLFLQVPMNSGALYNATQTIDTYVYRALMTLNQIGRASAASVYQSLVGFAVVMVVNGIVRKVDKENAMF